MPPASASTTACVAPRSLSVQCVAQRFRTRTAAATRLRLRLGSCSRVRTRHTRRRTGSGARRRRGPRPQHVDSAPPTLRHHHHHFYPDSLLLLLRALPLPSPHNMPHYYSSSSRYSAKRGGSELAPVALRVARGRRRLYFCPRPRAKNTAPAGPAVVSAVQICRLCCADNMSGPFKRRPSLRRPSMPGGLSGRRPSSTLIGRRSSTTAAGLQPQPQEVPWDLVDRCLLPVLFCHAAAVILSTLLNILHVSQVSTLTLFIWFTITTVGAVLFYHNLKVTAAGKAILISGCDGRLGATLARHLDELGFTVFAGFQNAAGSSLAEELKEEASGRLHVLQLDVSNEAQVLAASLYAVEHLPDGAAGLWAVVHAAHWVALGEIEWLPPQVQRRAFDVTVLGAARLTQVMLPLLRRAHGRIICVSSALARVAAPARGMHGAALAAIESLAACLRMELRPRGVDVVLVAPGEYTSGSAWTKDQDLVDQAREMWYQLCQEQRDAYGEDYFETAVRSMEKYTKSPDADLTAVTRSLTDAVVRTFPLPRYTPVTRQEKLQAFVADHLPRSVYDILYS